MVEPVGGNHVIPCQPEIRYEAEVVGEIRMGKNIVYTIDTFCIIIY